MRFGLFVALFAIAATSALGQASPAPSIQLYTLDCGQLEIPNMGVFSDTGEHAGEPGTIPVPCYLIRHGNDWMLWDTGLGGPIAASPNGEVKVGLRFKVQRTVESQLAQLNLKPDDVRIVALSHLHADHSGNIALFPKATFLVAALELAWARSMPTPEGVDAPSISPLARSNVDPLDGDRDVFGDGSVRILRAPGHTPGHRVLSLKLPKSGPMLITGDLFHTRENYEKWLVPSGNVSRADTLASFARFARLQANTHSRVLIQHSPEDYASIPAFPKYLD